MEERSQEIRFAFGRNWQQFLAVVDDNRINAAISSLQTMLERDTLDGMSFLDIGSGSGLFSLAASRLGATVRSFDYDLQSVACTEEMKRRFAPDSNWQISQGSILDETFVSSLGKFDVVYSWGVLHHTGAMWEAFDQAMQLVKPGGQFAISIYNDQGGASRRWRLIKKLYNSSPRPIQWGMIGGFALQHELKQFLIRLVRFQNPLPFSDWEKVRKSRGMSPWHDMIDWIGGYPFEVAKPEQVLNTCRKNGFDLTYLTTQAGGYGCNEYVFKQTRFVTPVE